MRNYILIGVSVVTGLLAFFIAKAQIDDAIRKSGVNDRKVVVVTVNHDMLAGEVLTFTDIGSMRVTPKEMGTDSIIIPPIGPNERAEDVVARATENFIGRRLVVAKRAGSFLLTNDFDISGNRNLGGILAGIVKKSYRALSLPVDVPASVSNMVQPNDHVDVLGTFRFPAAEKGTQMDTVTLTILQNVTVLAVGQQLANQRSAADRRGNYSTITLSVSPKEAEMLVFAQQKGVLTFTLRNNTDPYVARDVQDVNFEYLRENIKKYTDERGTRETLPVTTPRRGP